jgi:DNA invertase Pin-like site-specific DNA recombinase
MFPGSTWHRGIDLIAVERAMSGRGPCPELTDEEQQYAAKAMAEAGHSIRTIAERLGISDRTVSRWCGPEGRLS